MDSPVLRSCWKSELSYSYKVILGHMVSLHGDVKRSGSSVRNQREKKIEVGEEFAWLKTVLVPIHWINNMH